MSTAPTGQEHLTPVKIRDTSATERGGFRKCRREWLLRTVHRLDSQEGNVNYFLGRLFHWGLEAYYKALMGHRTPYPQSVIDAAEQAAFDAYQLHYTDELEVAKEQLGIAASFGLQGFLDSGALGWGMLENYLIRERDEPLFDEVIAVEFRVNVPIIPPGKTRKIGTLSVQTDVVGYKDEELTVADHKTAKSLIASAHLDLDDQLTAEVYSWWLATGDFPTRAVYNGAKKQVPAPPKRNKDKKGVPQLSKAKNQNTTFDLYTEEIRKLGLNPADYQDILAVLWEKSQSGEDKLFKREATFRTPGQMASFERDLANEFADMKRVAANPVLAYPNPTTMNCMGCAVRAICTTIQDGGDVEAVIAAGYVVGDPRR